MIYLSAVLRRKADVLGLLYEYLIKEKNNFFSFFFFFKESHSYFSQRVSSEMLKRCETTNFNWKFNIFYHAPNNNALAKKLTPSTAPLGLFGLWFCGFFPLQMVGH